MVKTTQKTPAPGERQDIKNINICTGTIRNKLLFQHMLFEAEELDAGDPKRGEVLKDILRRNKAERQIGSIEENPWFQKFIDKKVRVSVIYSQLPDSLESTAVGMPVLLHQGRAADVRSVLEARWAIAQPDEAVHYARIIGNYAMRNYAKLLDAEGRGLLDLVHVIEHHPLLHLNKGRGVDEQTLELFFDTATAYVDSEAKKIERQSRADGSGKTLTGDVEKAGERGEKPITYEIPKEGFGLDSPYGSLAASDEELLIVHDNKVTPSAREWVVDTVLTWVDNMTEIDRFFLGDRIRKIQESRLPQGVKNSSLVSVIPHCSRLSQGSQMLSWLSGEKFLVVGEGSCAITENGLKEIGLGSGDDLSCRKLDESGRRWRITSGSDAWILRPLGDEENLGAWGERIRVALFREGEEDKPPCSDILVARSSGREMNVFTLGTVDGFMSKLRATHGKSWSAAQLNDDDIKRIGDTLMKLPDEPSSVGGENCQQLFIKALINGWGREDVQITCDVVDAIIDEDFSQPDGLQKLESGLYSTNLVKNLAGVIEEMMHLTLAEKNGLGALAATGLNENGSDKQDPVKVAKLNAILAVAGSCDPFQNLPSPPMLFLAERIMRDSLREDAASHLFARLLLVAANHRTLAYTADAVNMLAVESDSMPQDRFVNYITDLNTLVSNTQKQLHRMLESPEIQKDIKMVLSGEGEELGDAAVAERRKQLTDRVAEKGVDWRKASAKERGEYLVGLLGVFSEDFDYFVGLTTILMNLSKDNPEVAAELWRRGAKQPARVGYNGGILHNRSSLKLIPTITDPAFIEVFTTRFDEVKKVRQLEVREPDETQLCEQLNYSMLKSRRHLEFVLQEGLIEDMVSASKTKSGAQVIAGMCQALNKDDFETAGLLVVMTKMQDGGQRGQALSLLASDYIEKEDISGLVLTPDNILEELQRIKGRKLYVRRKRKTFERDLGRSGLSGETRGALEKIGGRVQELGGQDQASAFVRLTGFLDAPCCAERLVGLVGSTEGSDPEAFKQTLDTALGNAELAQAHAIESDRDWTDVPNQDRGRVIETLMTASEQDRPFLDEMTGPEILEEGEDLKRFLQDHPQMRNLAQQEGEGAGGGDSA